MVSIQVVATPTIGFARSSSVKPIALSMARAPARSGPSVIAAEWRLAGSEAEGASDIWGSPGKRWSCVLTLHGVSARPRAGSAVDDAVACIDRRGPPDREPDVVGDL